MVSALYVIEAVHIRKKLNRREYIRVNAYYANLRSGDIYPEGCYNMGKKEKEKSMKKVAILIIAVTLILSITCMGTGLAFGTDAYTQGILKGLSGSVYINEFLVRFAYRASDAFGLKIISDPYGSQTADEATYIMDRVILTCESDGMVKQGVVSISDEVTSEELDTILCMINSLEYSWTEYSFYSGTEMWAMANDILQETMNGKEYKGKGYTYKWYPSVGLFMATINK